MLLVISVLGELYKSKEIRKIVMLLGLVFRDERQIQHVHTVYCIASIFYYMYTISLPYIIKLDVPLCTTFVNTPI